jgi:ketosteroid isomerase-like protein
MKTFLSLSVLALAACATGCTTTQPVGQTGIFAPGALTATQATARQAIDALNTEFAYLIDHDHSEGVADLFTESGVQGVMGGQLVEGREAIRRSYAERKTRGVRTARHLFTNLRLTFESESRVRGSTILLLFAVDGPPPHYAEPLGVADYEDIYERDPNGRWRFVSRLIRPVFSHRTQKPVILKDK